MSAREKTAVHLPGREASLQPCVPDATWGAVLVPTPPSILRGSETHQTWRFPLLDSLARASAGASAPPRRADVTVLLARWGSGQQGFRKLGEVGSPESTTLALGSRCE